MSKRVLAAFCSGLLLMVALCGAKRHAGNLVDIQAITKTRMAGWVFEKGPGTRITCGIEARFKVHGKGIVTLPVLAVYFFDRNKKQVEKVESYFVKKGVQYKQETDHRFKANQTQWVTFPYHNELKFAYFLVVAGEGQNVSARVSPATATPDDFNFQDK